MHSGFVSDLNKLNTLYNRIQFTFIFLYGRNGTGKTQLVRNFCKNKNTVFYSPLDTVPERQLFCFWKEITRCLKLNRRPDPFTSWSQAFSFLSEYSYSHRLVLVLDEFHSLAMHNEEFLEAFTYAVNHDFISGRIFLITTTSSVSYASSVMTEPLVPPYDMITARAQLGPLSFYNCQALFRNNTPLDQLLLYGITGGISSALEEVDSRLSARDCIIRMFFQRESPFFLRPIHSLRQELREVSTYNYLLEIIANGQTRLADIANTAGVGTNKCAKYLNTLIDMGILKKEFPGVGEIRKKVRYQFSDHQLRFWYRFVYPNQSSILLGNGAEIYETEVIPELRKFLLPVFEDLCSEYLEKLSASGQTPFTYHYAGSWWCGGTKKEPFFRVPIVAIDQTHAVIGTCHTEKEPADEQILRSLEREIEPFDNMQRYYCIFSVSGFSEPLKQYTKEHSNIWLIDLEDMI